MHRARIYTIPIQCARGASRKPPISRCRSSKKKSAICGHPGHSERSHHRRVTLEESGSPARNSQPHSERNPRVYAHVGRRGDEGAEKAGRGHEKPKTRTRARYRARRRSKDRALQPFSHSAEIFKDRPRLRNRCAAWPAAYTCRSRNGLQPKPPMSRRAACQAANTLPKSRVSPTHAGRRRAVRGKVEPQRNPGTERQQGRDLANPAKTANGRRSRPGSTTTSSSTVSRRSKPRARLAKSIFLTRHFPR